MIRKAIRVAIVLGVLVSTTPAKYWIWYPGAKWLTTDASEGKYLTSNNGARAVAIKDYSENGTWKHWVTVVASLQDQTTTRIRGLELSDQYVSNRLNEVQIVNDGEARSDNACIAAGGTMKNAAAAQTDGLQRAWSAQKALTVNQSAWTSFVQSAPNHAVQDTMIAVATEKHGDDEWVYIAWADDDGVDVTVQFRASSDGGSNWGDPVEVADAVMITGISLATERGGDRVYLAYGDGSDEEVYYTSSDNNGTVWYDPVPLCDAADMYGWRPCLAVRGDMQVVAWFVGAEGYQRQIAYRWSTNGGSTWTPDPEEAEPAVVPMPLPSTRRYDQPSIALWQDGSPTSRPYLLLLATCYLPEGTSVAYNYAFYKSDEQAWQWVTPSSILLPLHVGPRENDAYHPSLALADVHDTIAFAVWSDTSGNPLGRQIFMARGSWGTIVGPGNIGPPVWGPAPTLGQLEDGSPVYVAEVGPHVVSGPVSHGLTPCLVDVGWQPSLALDDDGQRWVVFVRDDTLMCRLGDGTYGAVFCGSSSARPGQPSIDVYARKGGAGYVGGAVFASYDSTASSSMILWAKFDADSTHLILDTVESVANLSDSCPSINILNDSVYIVWQHGTDSVVSAKLLDYGLGDWNKPPAWSSPELVTDNGYHPASRLESSMLNCVWSERIEVTGGTDTFNVCRATCDLDSGSMFPDWTAGTNPSAGGPATTTKSNAAYAGAGVSVWQEQVSGVWTIKASVRDSIVTLVASDTDAYHPHAVACSSAISPSIDQIRVHLLSTAGVTFEVDSGVYDTGEVRYQVDSFNVSNGGPGATRYNSGTKLVRKPGSDSLFAVYADADGGVYFAQSATGDSWKRSELCAEGEYPALAYDGTGRLWVVLYNTEAQEIQARYRCGDTWSTAKVVYTVEPGENNLSGISLVGSPDGTTSCAYAAFRHTNSGSSTYLVAAKFDADSLRLDTVAQGVVDNPCIAVENSGSQGDWLHITWEDNGNVKYTMSSDGWAADDWQGFPDWEQDVTLFESGQQAAHHPCLAANEEKLVIACALGSTPDIYARERTAADDYNDWDDTVNLSKTPDAASDYPVVFLGDSVALAWEEHRSEEDYDILACINYGDTMNLADNSTKTSYPHIVLQPVTSPDTTVILHLIASEAPAKNYYEVSYHKLDLADIGGGQQGAGTKPLAIEPALFPCRPNPFTGRTAISYQFPKAGDVSLRVFDASGRMVRSLQSGFQKPGRYTAVWDGNDTRGRRVANGIYFYRLDSPDYRNVKKAVLMR